MEEEKAKGGAGMLRLSRAALALCTFGLCLSRALSLALSLSLPPSLPPGLLLSLVSTLGARCREVDQRSGGLYGG